jgi:pimeloyl-ACP methyl ester carboxylesterase
MSRSRATALVTCLTIGMALLIPSLSATTADAPLTIDHYVRVRSTVPSMAGQAAQIYVRERALPSTVLRHSPASDRVVLFVHGAGTPAEVAFDVPYQDYSWMAYLANAGFDVFAMDMTGYGRSTRPLVMNDPCNLPASQQARYVPALIEAPCAATYPQQLTTIASDWHDIAAVVDYIRARRGVDTVSLVGWSLGGPRAGGFAAQHPDKVHKLVLLSPAYNPNASATPPATLPANGPAFNTQSRSDFDANWDRQIGCADQFDPAARESVWTSMLESDPVGATWGTGVRRAPQVTSWGWNAAMAARVTVPTLLVAPANDVQVAPAGVHRLFADLGSGEKVVADLPCASHNALWEHQHTMLFRASREWLQNGTVNGVTQGVVALGDGR